MTRRAKDRLLDAFSAALEEQRLHLVYQPKVSLRDGSLVRVEALMRWDDPELGSVEPSRFIPLAEEHGLIDELTQWGLRTILRQWLDWREEGLDTSIAFNTFDTNPIPIKYMMKRLGLIPENEHRLPMVPATPELEKRLDGVLERAGMLTAAAA